MCVYVCMCVCAARLPHGVESIRKHLQTVDNVPLLVSLYTDATPHKYAHTFTYTHSHTYTHIHTHTSTLLSRGTT